MVEEKIEQATFAGGCFWCMVGPFQELRGVIEVVSGYANGIGDNPTYTDYAQKGYVEAIQVSYDPKQISYHELLDVFWHQIDPTDAYGQFVDRGPQYRPAIFYRDDEQRKEALASQEALEKSGIFNKPLTIEISPFKNFYLAEQYHQNFYKESPERYKEYRMHSGRDIYLKNVWKARNTDLENHFVKPSKDELRKQLTPLQHQVTQCSATEKPFENAYVFNKDPGIYVDIVSGEPLFSSLEKYDSGTGWPSFFKPLEPNNLVEKIDNQLSIARTEVRSKKADSHLGHLFKDGPEPAGLRYCINSASLQFIPLSDLQKEGYGHYERLFETDNRSHKREQ